VRQSRAHGGVATVGPFLSRREKEGQLLKTFIVVSGTNIGERRELAASATEALRLVLEHMKLRRPGARIEDRRGNPVTFFQLKALAESEKDRSPETPP
jgi:hypothetical protein